MSSERKKSGTYAMDTIKPKPLQIFMVICTGLLSEPDACDIWQAVEAKSARQAAIDFHRIQEQESDLEDDPQSYTVKRGGWGHSKRETTFVYEVQRYYRADIVDQSAQTRLKGLTQHVK